MSIGWLELDFWRDILEDTARWGVRAGPRLMLVLVVAWLALRLTRFGLTRLEKRLINVQRGKPVDLREHEKRVDTLMGILRKVAHITIWSLVALVALVNLGVDVGPLVAGAGVIGLAVGFGAQELVRDVISGFFNLIENHVRAGDVAIINGTGGLVERIGLRTTVLRDLSGVVHVFQNGKIDTIANMTKEWSAMVFDVNVAYKEDTDRVCEVMTEVAEQLRADPAFEDRIIEPLELFGVDAFGDNAVVIKARLKTVPSEQWTVGREYNRRLKKAFDREGIEIPFPHRTLYWGEASKPMKLKLEDGVKQQPFTPEQSGPVAQRSRV